MDITAGPLEYNKAQIDSKYRLVVIASQRARELFLGAPPKMKTKAKKFVTTALLETVNGEVAFMTGPEAAAAREQAENIDYKKLLEGKRKAIADLSELEKDLKVYLADRGATEKALEELFNMDEDNE